MEKCQIRCMGRLASVAAVFAMAFVAMSMGLPGVSLAEQVETCLSCHPSRASTPSESIVTGVPALTGQHPEYIVKQLERFSAAAEGNEDPYRRFSIVMGHVAKELPASERLNIARKLSAQTCAFHGNPDPPSVEPNACAVCHGARGITKNPDVPNLAGQDLRYLFYQYQKLREPYLPDVPGILAATKPVRLHPVMGPVGAQLHDNVVSVLIYFSKLPCR